MEPDNPPKIAEKIGWTPQKIRARMALLDLDFETIAKNAGTPITGRAISQVAGGARRGLRARRILAKALGVRVTRIWPDAKPCRCGTPAA